MEVDSGDTKKQAVAGFKVVGYSVKKSKDTEKIKLVLEAEVGSVSAGECDMGDVMKALLEHSTGEVDVGLSLFVNK